MEPVELVPFATLSDVFEARVLAARLGANGIFCQIQGGGIDPTYPLGMVELLVAEDNVEAARELMLADEVEASFVEESRSRVRGAWFIVAVFVALVLFSILRMAGALGGQ